MDQNTKEQPVKIVNQLVSAHFDNRPYLISAITTLLFLKEKEEKKINFHPK